MRAPGVGERRHALAERAADLYETPALAVKALLEVEQLPPSIWEPACGRGAIVQVLRQRGRRVVTSDLVDYGEPHPDYVCDFFDFTPEMVPVGIGAIVTNPPFKDAARFVEHALMLCPRVIMLLRLAFLESQGRTDILEGGQLARVHVFRKRLPLMHRDNWTGKRSTSTMAFAWFTWLRDHNGPTTLHRL